MVQWSGRHASTAGSIDSIPDWETKIPHAMWHSQSKRERKKKRDMFECSLDEPMNYIILLFNFIEDLSKTGRHFLVYC